MVRMRRVLACGFAVVLMASFCSCSHGRSTAEKKTKNTKKEPVELKDDKSNWTDYDQVISYIENELGAVKTSYNDLTQEKWEQGYYCNDKDHVYSVGNLLDSSRNTTTIATRTPTTESLYIAKKLLNPNRPEIGLDKNYLDKSIVYFKYSEMNSEKNDHERDGKIPGEEENYVTLNCIMYLSFLNSNVASEFFSSFVETDFLNRAERYGDEIEQLQSVDDLKHSNYTMASCLISESASIKQRKIYRTLEDLPRDVYEFDETNQRGHYTYSAKDKWAIADDLNKSEPIPRYIYVKQVEKYLSVVIDGNNVILVFSSDYFYDGATPDIYYEEWPEAEYHNNEVISDFCINFGIESPYDVAIDDDLNRELCFTSKFLGEISINLPELYIRRKD